MLERGAELAFDGLSNAALTLRDFGRLMVKKLDREDELLESIRIKVTDDDWLAIDAFFADYASSRPPE